MKIIDAILHRLLGSVLVSLLLAGSSLRSADSLPTPVERWGRFEVALDGPSAGNPFAEVNLSAVFSHGAKSVSVAGFYDGDGRYRIRFMPDETGEWHYRTSSNAAILAGRTGSLLVGPPSRGNHGPVGVRYIYHFGYADGTAYVPIGTTSYTWIHRPEDLQELTLKTLAASPFNKLRMCVFPQDHGSDFMPPSIFPFAGTPPRRWDFARYNPAFFQLLEKRVGQLRDLGIECDLILIHPYGKTWGFDTMAPAQDDAYVRYVVARLGAYRNIWWSLANEYDYVPTKTEKDWDRLFHVVLAADPYSHLRSIHNGTLVYNNNHSWVTHASMQDGPAVENIRGSELLRRAYRKPVVFDEVCYEGDSPFRWAQLSGQEMVNRIWNGTVGGAYVGHSEYFNAPHDLVWLGQGGVLKGTSPRRIGFLRQIVEAGPASGIDPIDRWGDTDLGGKAGEYYLAYFGHAAPRSWKFEIPSLGARENLEFTADVIDTWNMTVTRVPHTFVTGKKDGHRFSDREGRAIALPGTPAIAIRLQRVNASQ